MDTGEKDGPAAASIKPKLNKKPLYDLLNIKNPSPESLSLQVNISKIWKRHDKLQAFQRIVSSYSPTSSLLGPSNAYGFSITMIYSTVS